jgi:2Fe-2S ferredoxin
MAHGGAVRSRELERRQVRGERQLTRITFIHPKNRVESIEANNDTSVMLEALRHGVRGIVAECGGNAICATCHVYVQEDWLAKLEPVQEDEDLSLDEAAARRLPNSRLCCQIRIAPHLNGLTLRLPDRQT